jgi:hypothetical protein
VVPGRLFSATIAAFVATVPPVTGSGRVIGVPPGADGPDVGTPTAAAGPASPNAGAADPIEDATLEEL